MLRHVECHLGQSGVSFFCVPSAFIMLLSLCRLRALSGGGGGGGSSGVGSGCTVASPPLSPALPKYKLAEYRYGREEMLALYVKDNKVGLLNLDH